MVPSPRRTATPVSSQDDSIPSTREDGPRRREWRGGGSAAAAAAALASVAAGIAAAAVVAWAAPRERDKLAARTTAWRRSRPVDAGMGVGMCRGGAAERRMPRGLARRRVGPPRWAAAY
jgi:hypothetical protein